MLSKPLHTSDSPTGKPGRQANEIEMPFSDHSARGTEVLSHVLLGLLGSYSKQVGANFNEVRDVVWNSFHSADGRDVVTLL